MGLFSSSSSSNKTTKNYNTTNNIVSNLGSSMEGAMGAANVQLGSQANFNGTVSSYYAPVSIAQGDEAVAQRESTMQAQASPIGINFQQIAPFLLIAAVLWFFLKK